MMLLINLFLVVSRATGNEDCRNRSWTLEGGDLVVLSWHIHYTTATSEFERFYWAFRSRFIDVMAQEVECPFGPNYAADSYKYVCSLDAEPDLALLGASPWTTPQRAFFVPLEYIDVAWAFALSIRGHLDLLKHPNTGCHHDDHSLRALWATDGAVPEILLLNFPCNSPTTGCNDSWWPDMEPSCGCSTPLASDAPEDSCGNCTPSLDVAAFPIVSPDTASWNCTRPPLEVSYSDTAVLCGTLFSQAEVRTQPAVTWRSKNASYALLMVDPDADLNGSWPDALQPGSRAPVRHWVLGNLAAADLARGLLDRATVLTSFASPSPRSGSHRYGLFLFAQPRLRIDFEPLGDENRTNWDYRGFLTRYGFGLLPTAANWFQVFASTAAKKK